MLSMFQNQNKIVPVSVNEFSQETMDIEATGARNHMGAISRGSLFISKMESNNLMPIIEEPADKINKKKSFVIPPSARNMLNH